jgi:heme exporter protein D
MMPAIQEFLHMGGYALYVWPAYGLTFIVLVFNVIIPLWREKDIVQSIAVQSRRDT